MNEDHHAIHADGMRLEIGPEPTEEELVAILQALRVLMDVDMTVTDAAPESNWRRIARRESLRPAEWAPQRIAWSGVRG